MAARRNTRTPLEPFAPRNLWLAALGLAAITRREAGNAATSALTTAGFLGQRLAGFAGDARDVARGGAFTLRERIEPAVGGFSAEVEARLAPVLEKLGLATPGGRAPRKPARRPAAKRPAAARRTTRKAAPTPKRKARATR
ncbi:hypothetical protein FQY83_14245 [Luteimonas marina]|uniref:Poly(Hydroxyalcanoate) granule associated protein n=1 Tax=Luteimonas marina TaxID=488485 RepID=A0A5C5TYY5_9GAMM|nr:hypothetical protein [Luteimonas marina]TWT18535.1 hypothetical protein FQY83_14245 [Luteimonas marina]